MSCQAVAVVNIYIGGKFLAALFQPPLLCCKAYRSRNAPPPALREYKNALQEQGRTVTTTIDIVTAYRHLGKPGGLS